MASSAGWDGVLLQKRPPPNYCVAGRSHIPHDIIMFNTIIPSKQYQFQFESAAKRVGATGENPVDGRRACARRCTTTSAVIARASVCLCEKRTEPSSQHIYIYTVHEHTHMQTQMLAKHSLQRWEVENLMKIG